MSTGVKLLSDRKVRKRGGQGTKWHRKFQSDRQTDRRQTGIFISDLKSQVSVLEWTATSRLHPCLENISDVGCTLCSVVTYFCTSK